MKSTYLHVIFKVCTLFLLFGYTNNYNLMEYIFIVFMISVPISDGVITLANENINSILRGNVFYLLLRKREFVYRLLYRHLGIMKLPNTYMPHRYTNILPTCEYKVKRPFVMTCAAKVFVSD